MYTDKELEIAKSYVLYDKKSKDFYDAIHEFWLYCLHTKGSFNWFEPETDWFDFIYANPQYDGYIYSHEDYESIKMMPKGMAYIIGTETARQNATSLAYLISKVCLKDDYRVGQALLDFVEGKEIDKLNMSFLVGRAIVTSDKKSLTNLGLVIWDMVPNIMEKSLTDNQW